MPRCYVAQPDHEPFNTADQKGVNLKMGQSSHCALLPMCTTLSTTIRHPSHIRHTSHTMLQRSVKYLFDVIYFLTVTVSIITTIQKIAIAIRRFTERLVYSSLIATRLFMAAVQVIFALALIPMAVVLASLGAIQMLSVILPKIPAFGNTAAAVEGAESGVAVRTDIEAGVRESAGAGDGVQGDVDLNEQARQIDRETCNVQDLGGLVSKAGALIMLQLQQLLPKTSGASSPA